MTVAIIQFGGSNCDNDVLHVLQDVLGIDAELVWYKEEKLDDYEAAVIPGGFSYGDYLRSGAIASRTPIMDAVRKMANDGKPVMGICNGFQILTESGLLDGALTTNSYPKFKCEWSYLKVENTNTPFTSMYEKGQVIRIPIAHKDGKYYNDDASLQQLEDDNQVVFRYVDESGNPNEAVNPNGSRNNIAGITNKTGNVLGMMPHPERASEKIIGSDDGLLMFKSMLIGQK
ncbi:phosphoribosylformylglycinamidine synthase I [Methanohalophilus portucalensis]|uniref:Phosphoribosylformylglycinamidine synthase subunit PurQ n=2 Tax=Methanohalophilus portucalensis TaxID=39664 RepID=A0A1L9C4B4_9EURY|nr:phosphoribosylformylglycinamidine synthase I [Methanohalophilus portucalensis]ATU07884.1 phosphoribosylformylglycinamidine synthase I [Methanohalophilus portucalensis]OJH49286.1 phosphoribosylformylglycinamidine synthase subunit I [Methanohalophilus portucalensis FDF-1]RNI11599.1 phosphoribosylformylglycinamidine synthase I [Methanohalophilus portucalensis FDF-1]SMH41989.1 phosphoribosylformylglycinamidine synthase subunit I [Methanohalophilus portucalensis FDF-1]